MSSWSCLPELSFVSVFVVVFVFVFIIVFIFVTILVFISHLPEHPRLAELLKAGRCVVQNSQGGRLRTHVYTYHHHDCGERCEDEKNENVSDVQLKTLREVAFVNIIMMVMHCDAEENESFSDL